MGHDHEHELPMGISSIIELPDDALFEDWRRIIVTDDTKQRLVNWAVLALMHGPQSGISGLGLQRVAMLIGPPGTGKSTLARGLGHAVFDELRDGKATALATVNPHAIPSDMLGQSQRNVMQLLEHSIPGIARRYDRLVVVIDEIEAFAFSRSSASFETNPVDLHRATDAVLTGLDFLARECPSVIVVGTSNFSRAIDDAVTSRVDVALTVARPGPWVGMRILSETLERLETAWPGLRGLTADTAALKEVAERCEGLDGRGYARLVPLAMMHSSHVAKNPGELTLHALRSAADELTKKLSS